MILTTFPLRHPSSHPGSGTRIIHAMRRPLPNRSPNVPKTSVEKRKAEAERQTLIKERNEAIRQFNAQKAEERQRMDRVAGQTTKKQKEIIEKLR